MPQYVVSTAFTRSADSPLGTFAGNIVGLMTDNPGFNTPRISMAELGDANTLFITNTAAALSGDKMAIAARIAARRALIILLHQQASYVQSVASMDLELLLSSGFKATSTNRTQVILAKPVIKKVENTQSTKLGVTVKPVPTGRAYELRYKFGTGEYQMAGIYSYAGSILLENLTPGVIYTIEVRAIGGLTGYSDWSDPISHMAL